MYGLLGWEAVSVIFLALPRPMEQLQSKWSQGVSRVHAALYILQPIQIWRCEAHLHISAYLIRAGRSEDERLNWTLSAYIWIQRLFRCLFPFCKDQVSRQILNWRHFFCRELPQQSNCLDIYLCQKVTLLPPFRWLRLVSLFAAI